jgi:hypothetical protein
MSNLKPLEKIAEQDCGDLLRLHLEANKHVSEAQKRESYVVGYRFSDGELYPVSGRGNLPQKASNATSNRGIDISSGSYFDARILGYEVLRKYKE